MSKARTTATLRNRQITAAGIRSAADALEMAFSNLAAAQHDANTSGITVDLYDALELGREPEQMVADLRTEADFIYTR